MELPPKLYYCTDGKTVGGPLLPIEIERQIRLNQLPANVLVCEERHNVWTDFSSWQKAKTANVLHGFSPATVMTFATVAAIGGIIVMIFLCWLSYVLLTS